MSEQLARFDQEVARPKSTFELMLPLEAWLYWNGFDSDFLHSALVPVLTPLFVTQNGNSAQSAGATCNHFNKESGFLSFNATDQAARQSPPIFHSVGGVQYMY